MTKIYNKRESYQCPSCKESFRLKMALNNHKCKNKFHRKREIWL
ncbi:hypothetical protein LCGC14_2999270, partial [marine sediment metagenome]